MTFLLYFQMTALNIAIKKKNKKIVHLLLEHKGINTFE